MVTTNPIGDLPQNSLPCPGTIVPLPDLSRVSLSWGELETHRSYQFAELQRQFRLLMKDYDALNNQHEALESRNRALWGEMTALTRRLARLELTQREATRVPYRGSWYPRWLRRAGRGLYGLLKRWDV